MTHLKNSHIKRASPMLSPIQYTNALSDSKFGIGAGFTFRF